MYIIIHNYFLVQCQLLCTKRTYCDFVVWTTKDIHVERLYPDEKFISTCVEKAKAFFVKGILPELLGKFFSRPPKPSLHSSTDDDNTTADRLYCYCQ